MSRCIKTVTIVALSWAMLGISQSNLRAQQAPTSAPAAQEAAADPTSPKGTLIVLSRATQSGDTSNVSDLFYATNPQEKQLAGILLERTEVYAKFRLALVKAFGEEAATQLTGNSADDEKVAEQRINESELKIDGDKASVLMKPEAGQPPQDPVQLVKVDGKWRLPVGKLTEGMQPPDIDKRLSEFKILSGVVTETTGEVSQSKYKTAEEVSNAMRGKLASAMMAEAARSTTTAPAVAPQQP